MKRLPLTLCAIILLLAAPVMAAADCPALVKQALAVTDNMCQTTGSNEACYGNIHLQAKPNSSTPNFIFSQPGDRVNLSEIKSLQLSPMQVDTGEWGVALMHIQANMPAQSKKNLMLLAFGDVAIQNDALTPTASDVEVVGSDAINVRRLPNLNAGAVAVLKPGQEVTAVERLKDTSWLRINLPDSGETGWVKSDLLKGTDDLSRLNVVEGSQPNYRPMQAFTFISGQDQPKCAEIPNNGLIIQTPEGAGEIRLWVNQVVVKLGSTVYFQAQPNGDMIITTLEGHATVEALGVSHTAVAGTRVHVKMGADMKPVAPPSLPQSYTATDVQNLPVTSLQRTIAIHAPLTDAEVAIVQQQQQAQVVVGNVAGAAVDTLNNVVDSAGNVVSSAVDTAGNTVNTVVDTAGNVVGSAVDTAGNVVSGAVDTAGNVVSGAVDTAGNVVGDVVGGDSGNSGSGDSGNDDDGGLLGGILNLPCKLLQCNK